MLKEETNQEWNQEVEEMGVNLELGEVEVEEDEAE